MYNDFPEAIIKVFFEEVMKVMHTEGLSDMARMREIKRMVKVLDRYSETAKLISRGGGLGPPT